MNPNRQKGLVEKATDPIPEGISTEVYIDNISKLISYIRKK